MILVEDLRYGNYYSQSGIGYNRKKITNNSIDLANRTVDGVSESLLEGIPMNNDWLERLNISPENYAECLLLKVHEVQNL